MVNHLNRIAVLFAVYSFAALTLSAAPGLTADIPKTQKQLNTNDSARLVLYKGKQAVWDRTFQDLSLITLSLSTDAKSSLNLLNEGNKKASSSELKPEDYHGKMVKLDGGNSHGIKIWLVGADGKRRLIPNQKTYECLKRTGLEDPISVSSKILDQIPNLEKVRASCGADRIGPDGSLEKGSYLKAGDYKLILNNRDLVLTKNGNQVWAAGSKPAEHLILQKDGNLVTYNSGYLPVWNTGTYGRKPGWLILEKDGSLNLYDDNKRIIWFR